uniref:Anoctamin n=1 Tax=Salarias fasciatus TaxID=181472 RepID=A0A672H7N9_SALFA
METTAGTSYGSIVTNAPLQPGDRNVFSDGSTRVDFVLVWEEPRVSQEDKTGAGPAHRKWREEFLSRLKRSGLLLEWKEVVQVKKKICFVLLSAPWSVLCYYAEEISLRVPLQVVNAPLVNWSQKVLCLLQTFFKTTQRHQVVSPHQPSSQGDFQLSAAPVAPQDLGLRQILYSYWAQWSCWRRYQPLDHIREYFGEKIALYFAWLGFYTGWLFPASVMGTVIFLVGVWLMATDVPAKEVCDSGNGFIMCPLCNICSYWNYSSICVTYKVGLLFDNGGTVFFSVFMSLWAVTFLEYWKRTCSALSHRWDCSDFQDIEERPRPEFAAMAPMTVRNPVTGAEEPYFPEKQRFSRTVTGCMVIIIMVTVVLMFLISIILYRTILSIVIYKSANSFFSFAAGRIASFTGSVLNLLVILMLSKVYTALAHLLTRWEMHRTQTKYEDMFILKVFIFQFVNFYSSPVYIAFFKGRFIGYPGNYNTLLGVRNEDCGAGGCLIELAQELLVIMVGKQLINNVQEKLKPQKEEKKLKEAQEEEEKEEASPWEQDYQLLVCEGLFDEYLEMVLQFGFITIFVAACPLAPLFALINNWVEIRLDAQKFVTEYRRPVVERAQDIGIWFPILQFITHMAVLSNAFLIAFTSSFLPRLYYRYTQDRTLSGFINFTLATSPRSYSQQHNTTCRYRGFRDENGEYLPEYFHLLAIQLSFVIIFEHVVFLIGRLIDLMVPDVPEEVEMKMKREHYMAKEALAENQVQPTGTSGRLPSTKPNLRSLSGPPGTS